MPKINTTSIPAMMLMASSVSWMTLSITTSNSQFSSSM